MSQVSDINSIGKLPEGVIIIRLYFFLNYITFRETKSRLSKVSKITGKYFGIVKISKVTDLGNFRSVTIRNMIFYVRIWRIDFF